MSYVPVLLFAILIAVLFCSRVGRMLLLLAGVSLVGLYLFFGT